MSAESAQKDVDAMQYDMSNEEFDLDKIIEDTENIIFMLKSINYGFKSLTPAQKLRLTGAGVKNYGFIDKSFDLATENIQFLPQGFSIEKLSVSMKMLEKYRQLTMLLETAKKISSDIEIVEGDTTYKMCLLFYDYLKICSKAGVVSAQEIFDKLSSFFKSRGRRKTTQATQKQVKSDVKLLMKGKKDGRVIIENVSAEMIGGRRKVIDE